MDTRRSEWEEYKELKPEKLRTMDLNKFNNLLTSGSWPNKDSKDAQILEGVAQILAYDSKKSSEKPKKSNRESTKGEPAYIRDLPL